MSGRLGECFICNKWGDGMYTLDIYRGWVGDKYEFNKDICEDCVPKLLSLIEKYRGKE